MRLDHYVLLIITLVVNLAIGHDLSSQSRGRHLLKKRQAQVASSLSGSINAQTSSTILSSSSGSSLAPPAPVGASISSAMQAVPTMPSLTSAAAATTLGPYDIPPLTAILVNATPEATASLTTTYAPGQTPAAIKGAPGIPQFNLNSIAWPKMDVVAPIDSPQVQQWIAEVAASGIPIPDLQPTTDGSCASDPALAADAEARGWWTCGGWTAPTDIVACPDEDTWGVSFDDGPGPYTQKLLTYLDKVNVSATFFCVGSRVISYPNILVEEYMGGHEISVHTWSHHALTSLTNEQIIAELGWTKLAIQSVLGVTPVTMRPPFGDIDNRVRAISLAMGMIPIIWTRYNGQQFDTNDWRIPAGQVTGPQSFASFQSILGNATLIDTGFIVLEHDLYQQTVDMAVGYTLPAALNFTPQLTLEPIGQCQHWPPTDLYAETTTNTSFPYHNASSTVVLSTTVSGKVVLQTVTPGSTSTSLAGSTSKSSAGTRDRGAPKQTFYLILMMLSCLFGAVAILI